MRRTKIVCTLGPATSSPEAIGQLIDAGMNVARLNFSHGAHEEHARSIALIREQAALRGAPVAILQDLCGPKIRVGQLRDGGVELNRNDRVALCAARDEAAAKAAVAGYGQAAAPVLIPIDLPDLRDTIQPGARIYINDGLVRLRAEEAQPPLVLCRVEAGGTVTSRKGVNLPGSASRIGAITEKDMADLRMGLAHGVDFVALSFVRSAGDVRELRERMKQLGRVAPIVAKVEKAEALDDLNAIVAAADAVMVARGDLGIEVDIAKGPLIQKRLIRACNAAGKPVITATQMLDSMVENPIPTRAEVSDVANAILDGTDAVMLSQETAIGKRPAEVVAMMARIAEQAETLMDFRGAMDTRESFGGEDAGRDAADAIGHCVADAIGHCVADAIGHAVCQIARDLDVRGIIACTMSGSTARLIARYRPGKPIYAVTPDENTWRQLSLTWGARPVRVRMQEESEALVSACVEAVRAADPFAPPCRFVLTAGLPIHTRGITNLIRIVEVDR